MLAFDSVWLREPNLLLPGEKPINNVVIDYDHPMAKDIIFYALPIGNVFLNIASPNYAEQVPSRQGYNIENGLLRTGSNQEAVFDNVNIDVSTITIATRANLFSENNSSGYIFGGDNVDVLLAYENNTNRYQLNLETSTNWSRTGVTFQLNRFYDIMAIAPPGAFGTNGFWLVDRERVGPTQGSSSSSTINQITNDITVGNRSSDNRWFDGLIEYLVIWSRDLSEDEGRSFQLDPYVFLTPA